MSRSIARARAGRERTTLYQEITDKIITELKAGRVPWIQPWGTVAAKASLTMPKNAATYRYYSGINLLTLWGAVIDQGFSTQNWLTFRQALRLGGSVRKGERGTTVLYADHFVPDEERRPRAKRDGREPNAIQFLKRLTVFNTDQCQDPPREVASEYIPSIFRSESTTHPPNQAILFTACDALEHDALQKAISPTRQIDHWLASDFDGAIMFGESVAEQHAAGEKSESGVHDNLIAIPLAASTGDKAAA
jgi:antirestriction protein ArdC